MKYILLLMTCLLLHTSVQGVSSDRRQSFLQSVFYPIDDYILAIQWIPKNKEFSIHGLWPNSVGEGPEYCRYKLREPNGPSEKTAIDEAYEKDLERESKDWANLIKGMNKHWYTDWPGKTNLSFWAHEFGAHGNCYDPDRNRKDDDLNKAFFQRAVDLFKSKEVQRTLKMTVELFEEATEHKVARNKLVQKLKQTEHFDKEVIVKTANIPGGLHTVTELHFCFGKAFQPEHCEKDNNTETTMLCLAEIDEKNKKVCP
mmetsp:Transcript_37741/g.42748  ORF Transcript_37741/g.42748 Transcript_37741/m.42748 type:complete len:257 (+) Transcript_37741:3-773(+)